MYNKKCNSKVVLPFHAIPGSIEYRIVKNIIFLCLCFLVLHIRLKYKLKHSDKFYIEKLCKLISWLKIVFQELVYFFLTANTLQFCKQERERGGNHFKRSKIVLLFYSLPRIKRIFVSAVWQTWSPRLPTTPRG